jgi:hypothetical protein
MFATRRAGMARHQRHPMPAAAMTVTPSKNFWQNSISCILRPNSLYAIPPRTHGAGPDRTIGLDIATRKDNISK